MMSPLTTWKERRKARRKERIRIADEAFKNRSIQRRLAAIDCQIAHHGLDPRLRELELLRKEVVDKTDPSRPDDPLIDLAIEGLDPYRMVHFDSDGGVRLYEDSYGMRTLFPWSVVRYHAGAETSRRIDQIVVNFDGTHVFVGETRVAYYQGGICNPHRLNDQGNRLNNAALFIKHLTGCELTSIEELWQKYSATAIRGDDGWTISYSTDPATKHLPT